MSRLQADEAAVDTGERERFGASVDRFASDHMLKRDTFVPPVPLLVATEGATHARAAALEEIAHSTLPASTTLAGFHLIPPIGGRLPHENSRGRAAFAGAHSSGGQCRSHRRSLGTHSVLTLQVEHCLPRLHRLARSRASTALRVSAGVLAAGPAQPSYSSDRLACVSPNRSTPFAPRTTYRDRSRASLARHRSRDILRCGSDKRTFENHKRARTTPAGKRRGWGTLPLRAATTSAQCLCRSARNHSNGAGSRAALCRYFPT